MRVSLALHYREREGKIVGTKACGEEIILFSEEGNLKSFTDRLLPSIVVVVVAVPVGESEENVIESLLCR